MTQQEQIISDLQLKLEERDSQIAEMEGDILATVSTLGGVLKSLGLNPADLVSNTGEKSDLMQKIAVLLPKITMQFATGTFDTQAVHNLSSLLPVFDKYKYLTDQIDLHE